MANNKGSLVPINFNGKWVKSADGCWEYDAVCAKFIRVTDTTTYGELINKICRQMRISLDDYEIEVHAWSTYMTKEKLGLFLIEGDEDILTFMELNADREYVIPLCITKRAKGMDFRHSPPHVIEEKHESPVHDEFVSKSVNKPYGGEVVVGLDDIVMTNPHPFVPHPFVDNIRCDTTKKEKLEKEVKLESESTEELEKEDSNDEFESDDPFDSDDFDNHYEQTDPFDYALSGNYDPYFQVFMDSRAEVNRSVHVSPHAESMANSLEVPETHPADHDTPICAENGISRNSRRNLGMSDVQSSNIHVLKDFSVGEILPRKDELILRLRYICMMANREFKITHSNTKRVIAKCRDKDCKWRIRGSYRKDYGDWVISVYVKSHNCSIDSRSKFHRGTATSSVIGHMVKDDDNRPKVIQEMLEKRHGIKVSYWKAWRSKDIAKIMVRGDPAESFKGLPSYFWLLNEANPGTISAYEVNENNCFEQCFLAFGPCVIGFRSNSIRPVIAVDASFLKGRYKGKIFIAACMDGNNQIYPLAFGVAATENDMSWSWFFKKLKEVVGNREDLVFISDRHPSIEKCCKAEFPDSTYGICMFHLGMNMTAKYKVKAQDFLYGVAKAYTKIEFDKKFQHMKHTPRDIYDYLMDADPSKWARCFFPARRYSIMTTNIAESMNALLKEAREFPIIGMLETIRTILQRWFHDRLRVGKEWTNKLTPHAEEKLQERDDESRHFSVNPLDEFRFHILDGQDDPTVDINLRKCTCNVFQLDQLPCSHAIRACRKRNISVYDMCSRFYTIDCLRLAYALPMNPVPNRRQWDSIVPEVVKSVVVLPPVITNNKGRRKKKRMPSQGEEIVRNRCGRCRQTGHNKQTCTYDEYVPVHPLDRSQ